MFKKIVEKIIIWPENVTRLSRGNLLFWIVWYIASDIFIDGVLTNDPFALGYSLANDYWIGMLPLIFAFHDRENVKNNLMKKYSSLHLSLLKHNMVFLAILLLLPIILNYDYGLEPLVRETTITIYWLFSIVLLFIESIKIRYIVAMFIYLNCFLYSLFLQKIYWNICYISNVYLLLTIGAIFVVFLICVIIIDKQLNLICGVR